MGKYGTSFIKWSQVCQGSARTHKRINYLAVDGTGRRMCWGSGNDKTLSGRHKLPLGGAPETTRSRLAAATAQPDVLSCVQTITGNLDRKKKKIRAWALFPLTVIPRLEKEGNAPFPPRFPPPPQPSKDLASRWHDVTCYLSYLSNWTQARVPVSALYCQGTVGVGGGGGWQVCSRALISNHQQPSQRYDVELPFLTGPFFQFERNVQF